MNKRLLLIFALLITLSIPLSLPASQYPVSDLRVNLYPGEGKIQGWMKVKLPDGLKADFDYSNLKINEMKINGKNYPSGSGDISRLKGDKLVEIRYTAEFKNPHRRGKGMVLLSNWYPRLRGISVYKLTVNLPADYHAVSEYDTMSVRSGTKGKTIKFNFPSPVDAITLVAGKYKVTREIYRGIALRTYFFKDDRKLVSRYIEHTKKYLDLYMKMLGGYPFKSFNIVENSFQTGYSFPTYTLLGSRVLRLPFIVKTSLGHEILHQWFGNYVYVDYEKGNWAEGLTTYLADHWYKHTRGEGSNYRKKILIDYDNYMDEESEKGLRSFKSGANRQLRALGYGKAAMVFHMLRKKLGDEKFFTGLKKFIADNRLKRAGWNDIKNSYGKFLNNDSFFEDWVEKKGIISLDLKDVNLLYRKGRYLLTLRLEQKNHLYRFGLPVKVETERGGEERVLPVDKKARDYKMSFKEKPLRITLDPEYDLMRSLTASEKPAVISSLMGNSKMLLVAPGQKDERKKYNYAIEFFKSQGINSLSERETRNSHLKEHSVIILSAKNSIYRRLFADKKLPGAGLVVRVEKNPLNEEKSVMLIHAKSESELVMALRKLRFYGGYSFLLFNKGKNIKKTVSGSHRGIVRELETNISALETEKTLGIEDVVEKIKNKSVVYVGEVHTNYSHHLAQFEVIKGLYKIHGKLLIGMEMFQKPYQKYLDKYVKGEIGERELLKKTEYFRRWRYDYNLYRDILHFARDKKIRVVALNLRGEIVKKVSRKGIDSLTPEERKEIPPDMDLTNADYRESMFRVMKMHSRGLKLDVTNFFQAQILWDESMAHNAVNAMKESPGVPMVILAGNGHLRYSWGIPHRVKRLFGAHHSVILLGDQGDIGRSVADFIIFPEEVTGPRGAQLGIYLTENSDGVLVNKLVENSPAMKGGVKENDIIISINGQEVKEIPDLKIILMNKKRGEKIDVTVKRKVSDSSVKELTLKCEL
jgi:aminopeptidase N